MCCLHCRREGSQLRPSVVLPSAATTAGAVRPAAVPKPVAGLPHASPPPQMWRRPDARDALWVCGFLYDAALVLAARTWAALRAAAAHGARRDRLQHCARGLHGEDECRGRPRNQPSATAAGNAAEPLALPLAVARMRTVLKCHYFIVTWVRS